MQHKANEQQTCAYSSAHLLKLRIISTRRRVDTLVDNNPGACAGIAGSLHSAVIAVNAVRCETKHAARQQAKQHVNNTGTR